MGHAPYPALCIAALALWFVEIGMAGAGHAAENSKNREEPVVSEVLVSGMYELQGAFEVAAGVHTVWQVLTDYDHLPRFVPSVHKSVAEIASDGGLVVEQELKAKALIFSRTLRVRLAVHEQPERRIDFRDLADNDFDVYRGSWSIAPTSVGSKVTYLLSAKPHEAIPDFIARGAFKESAQLMLGELQSEIARRALIPASSPEPIQRKAAMYE